MTIWEFKVVIFSEDLWQNDKIEMPQIFRMVDT